MPTPIELRPAQPSDAPALADLARATFVETFGGLYPDADMEGFLASAYSAELQAGEMADPQWRTWVLAQDGRLLGFAQLVLHCPLHGGDPDTSAELRRIYVRRDALGGGLGRRLLTQVLETARATGNATLWLGVWEHNDRAQAFYRTFGFTRVGQHDFMVGSCRDTDHLLALDLRLPSYGA